jgi:hypothetical protein
LTLKIEFVAPPNDVAHELKLSGTINLAVLTAYEPAGSAIINKVNREIPTAMWGSSLLMQPVCHLYSRRKKELNAEFAG